ncbi:uncharacterized protein LOC110878771 [Helianthus annuus]|uniref:uncharacterized protein LOC110878771 n=1 Tax=Helianthus annuus TaxID=4232 RepID=UPI001652E771|nr:uncharacterized protein LOC110878771 [Helianthus annuus]
MSSDYVMHFESGQARARHFDGSNIIFHSLYLTTKFVSSIQTLHLSLQTLTLTFISSIDPPPLLHRTGRRHHRLLPFSTPTVASWLLSRWLQDPTLSQQIRHQIRHQIDFYGFFPGGYCRVPFLLPYLFFFFLLFESNLGNVSDLPFDCGFVNDGACGWKIWQDLWFICSRFLSRIAQQALCSLVSNSARLWRLQMLSWSDCLRRQGNSYRFLMIIGTSYMGSTGRATISSGTSTVIILQVSIKLMI